MQEEHRGSILGLNIVEVCVSYKRIRYYKRWSHLEYICFLTNFMLTYLWLLLWTLRTFLPLLAACLRATYAHESIWSYLKFKNHLLWGSACNLILSVTKVRNNKGRTCAKFIYLRFVCVAKFKEDITFSSSTQKNFAREIFVLSWWSEEGIGTEGLEMDV